MNARAISSVSCQAMPSSLKRIFDQLAREFEPWANAIHQRVPQAALDEALRSDGFHHGRGA